MIKIVESYFSLKKEKEKRNIDNDFVYTYT